MKMTIETIPEIAHIIIKKSHEHNSDAATVLTLYGDLGAGKTTFTQEIARQLGIKENVISPTFVIMKRYEVTDEKFTHIIHIDAYRLTKSEELLKLGWEEILKDKNNIIIIEWPENIPDCIPETALKIKLSHKGDEERDIEF